MSNILFVCTANRDRSRTAEIYFQNKYPQHRFRSAGINKFLSERHGGIHLKQYMLDCADKVFCAEQLHFLHINQHFDIGFKSKYVVMELGDTNTFMSPELIYEFERKFYL